MISHRFEENCETGLSILAAVALWGCYLYLAYHFCLSWNAKNIPDMIGFGIILCLLSPGGKK